MKQLLSYLRALSQMYQHMHWRVQGPNYYGDHLLYERLYDGVNAELDQVAEKTIGVSGNSDEISPNEDSGTAAKMLSSLISDDDPSDKYPELAIKAEKALVDMIKSLMSGDTTDGVEDLLQGIASKHEEHLYLLQQRAKKEANVFYRLSVVAGVLDQKGYYDLANGIDKIIKGAK
jgi:DNA-binding ferritin-like protein